MVPMFYKNTEASKIYDVTMYGTMPIDSRRIICYEYY